MLRSASLRRPGWVIWMAVLPLLITACAGPGMVPIDAPAPAALPHAVIPLPAEIRLSGTERFVLDSATVITVQPGSADLQRIAGYLSKLIGPSPQAAPRVVEAAQPRVGSIHLTLHAGEPGDEGYDLTITPQGIVVTAAAPGRCCSTACRRSVSCCPPRWSTAALDGRALQRARRCASSTAPRFAWRGAMLDVVAPLLRRRRRQALHRPDGAVQAEPPAPAPLRRPGLAHRDPLVAQPARARRQHPGRRRPRRLLHAGRVRARSSPTRRDRYITDRARRSTCRATPTRRSRRTPS